MINKYNNEDYKEQKEHIYDIYLNNIKTKEGRDNLIKFMKKVSRYEQIKLIEEKLLKKCIFTKEEFYSDKENYKIKTLWELIKEFENDEKFLDLLYQAEKGNESAENLINIIDSLIMDLNRSIISKKVLENFLNIKKDEEKIKKKIKMKRRKTRIKIMKLK